MENLRNKLKEYWSQRNLIPTGAWVFLLSYSLVAFGSPMPPSITWLEIVMGGGLLIGGIMLAKKVIRQAREDAVARWALILALTLLIVPICVGLVHGNTWNNIERDIFPYLFLLAPSIFFVYSSTTTTRSFCNRVLAVALVVVGIATALTFFVGIYKLVDSPGAMVSMISGGLSQAAVGQAAVGQAAVGQAAVGQAAELTIDQEVFNEKVMVVFLKLYDPAMLFAAIFLSAWGVVWIVKSWATSVQGVFLMILGGTMAYGFMILGLRAYAVFFVLAVGIVSATKWREEGIYLRLFPVLGFLLLIAWPQIESILQLLWTKQQTVGSNGKIGEWRAVFAVVFQSFHTAMLGIGWGGLLINPILDEQTRFTHSALSYYLLKSGLLGLLCQIFCIWLLMLTKVRDSLREFSTFKLIALVSCVPTLIIGALFQPIYKTLSYGIVLALLIMLISSKESEDVK